STRRGPRGSGERPKRPAPDAAARPAAPTIPAMAAVRAGKRDVAEGDVAQEAFMPRTLVGAAGPGGEIAPPVRWSTPCTDLREHRQQEHGVLVGVDAVRDHRRQVRD